MSTEDGEVLWLDEEFDASGGKAATFECEDHLMDAWRSDLEGRRMSFSDGDRRKMRR
jgi:hypothetical protein